MQQSMTTSKQPATLSPVESQSIMLFLEMTTEKCAVLYTSVIFFDMHTHVVEIAMDV